jgi:hypothetical protein
VRAVTTFKSSHVPQVKAQDATFFVAQQFAQYARFPATELPFELREDSLLTVAFSAEGSVTPTDNTATLMPPLLLQCRLDGKPCAPGDNESQIQFKFSPGTPAGAVLRLSCVHVGRASREQGTAHCRDVGTDPEP